eukprot:GHVT01005592.1.p1 GENE.GHVT01005592.1~~GHVT01005592.1.p1  ORF type:complete len:250 (+),score=66.59 GHVT01005592.1:478-1227(+)
MKISNFSLASPAPPGPRAHGRPAPQLLSGKRSLGGTFEIPSRFLQLCLDGRTAAARRRPLERRRRNCQRFFFFFAFYVFGHAAGGNRAETTQSRGVRGLQGSESFAHDSVLVALRETGLMSSFPAASSPASPGPSPSSFSAPFSSLQASPSSSPSSAFGAFSSSLLGCAATGQSCRSTACCSSSRLPLSCRAGVCVRLGSVPSGESPWPTDEDGRIKRRIQQLISTRKQTADTDGLRFPTETIQWLRMP